LADAPQWALSNNFLHWVDLQTLLVRNSAWNICNSLRGTKAIEESTDSNYSNLLQTVRYDDRIVNSDVLISTINESLSGRTEKLQEERKDNRRKNFSKESELNISKTIHLRKLANPFKNDKTKILSKSQREICQDADVSHSNCVSKYPIDVQSIARLRFLDSIKNSKKTDPDDSATSATLNKPLNLVISLKESACGHIHDQTKGRLDNYRHSSIVDKETYSVDSAILRQIDHSLDVQSSYDAKHKNIDYGLLKLSDLNELSKCNSDRGKELLETVSKLRADNGELNGTAIADDDLKQERAQILDKYVTHVLPPRLSDSKPKGRSSRSHLQSNVKCNNIKKESCIEEEAHKSESTDLVTGCNPTLNNWVCFDMSGQYPGHSRPPVGTPPPQTVWNHLTMTQGQGNFGSLCLFNKIYINMIIDSIN